MNNSEFYDAETIGKRFRKFNGIIEAMKSMNHTSRLAEHIEKLVKNATSLFNSTMQHDTGSSNSVKYSVNDRILLKSIPEH